MSVDDPAGTAAHTGEPTIPAQKSEPDAATAARVRKRIRTRRVVSGLLSLVVVVGIFYYFLPNFADFSKVSASIRDMTSTEVAILVVAAVWNLMTYLFVMVPTMPALTYRQAFVVTESSTAAANTLPGGGAIGIGMSFAMYASWGFSRSRATVSLTVAGIWNNFAKLGLPVVALGLVALQGNATTARIIAATVGIAALVAAIVLFALLLRSDEWAGRVGRLLAGWVSRLRRMIRRGPVTGWDIATRKFRSRVILLVRARWHVITVATLVSHLSLYLVLLLALRAVGVSDADVSWAEVLAVFAFARLVTAIPITPGGVGIVEVALIAGLTAAGGQRDDVTAATLVYRSLTYLLPIPIGLLMYAFWRRNRSWRRPPNSAPRTPLVPETTPPLGAV